MKDPSTFLSHVSTINNFTSNLVNITNTLSHIVSPCSSSTAAWGIYGNQQTWADLHLR
ncbi:hypothetical protein I4U23_012476 [Adineta vaga]|nr:hypothetical protein I4U23_012476 [Adineta vaga]